MSRAGGPIPLPRYAWAHARRFGVAHWRLLLWFAAASLLRVAATVAGILLIRDFLTGVLSEPSGLAASLTSALGQTTALWVVAALLLAVFTIGGLAAYASQIVMQRLVRLFELDLMERLITHMLRLPVAFFDRRQRGDLVESIRQDVARTRAGASAAIEMVVLVAQAAAYLGSAVVISPALAVTVLPVLLLAAAPGQWLARHLRRRSFSIRRHGYRLTDLLLQLLQGVRIVKVYGGQGLEAQNAIARARRYFDELVAAIRVRAMSGAALETLGGLSVVVIIVVGGFQVLNNRLSLPSLVALLVAIRAAHGPLSNSFAQFMEIQANWASFERLHALFGTAPEPQDPPEALPIKEAITSLRFDRVSFGYDAQTPVVTDVSFEIAAGQHVGIVGPSGAGKTTIASLIARFYDPSAGRILLDGRDLRDYRRSDLYRHLALVTQDLFVFGTSVRDNIRYGRLDASDAEVERAAAAAEIHDDIMALPEGYNTVLGVGGRLLSAGQVQRVNVARALLRNAQLIILDEATSSLDSISEARIQLALDRLLHGRTTITIAHRLSTLRNADLIIVLAQGRVAGVGSHEALLGSCPLYRELWSAQQAGMAPPEERATPLV